MYQCTGEHVSAKPSMACSGHGECVHVNSTDALINAALGASSEYQCLCQPGWTGASDWVSAAGMDCHLNATAIRALWGFLLLNLLLVYCAYLPSYLRTLRKFYQSQTIKMSKFRKPRRITEHTTLFTLLIYFFITSPILCSFCVLMLIYPTTQHVGEDLAPTLLWWFGRSTFYVCSSLYQPALISTLVKKHVPGAQNIMSRGVFSTWSMISSHWVVGALVFVAYGVDNRRVDVVTWIACMGGTALILAIIAMQAIHLKRTLIIQLDDAYRQLQSIEIKQTKERMESVQNHVFLHSVSQMVIYICFAAIPLLRTYYDYLLPIVWLTIPLTARVVVRTLMIEQAQGHHDGLPTIISEGVDNERGLSETELTRGTVIVITESGDGRLLAVGDKFRGDMRKKSSASLAARSSTDFAGSSMVSRTHEGDEGTPDVSLQLTNASMRPSRPKTTLLARLLSNYFDSQENKQPATR